MAAERGESLEQSGKCLTVRLNSTLGNAAEETGSVQYLRLRPSHPHQKNNEFDYECHKWRSQSKKRRKNKRTL